MATIEPIRNPELFKKIESFLYRHYGGQYADIWAIGLNVGLRIGDLLALTIEDAEHALRYGHFAITEEKTGKKAKIIINDTVRERLHSRIESSAGSVYLFQSKSNNTRNVVKALSRQAVYKAFREAGVAYDVKIGTHTMRKSYGYTLHKAGHPIEVICNIFNHSHTSVTMRYIGLNQDIIDDARRSFEIAM
jgi:integrase